VRKIRLARQQYDLGYFDDETDVLGRAYVIENP